MDFLVAGCWAVYLAMAIKDNPIDPFVYAIAVLSQPIVFAGSHFHFGISVYWVLTANAATYALYGLVVGNPAGQLKHAS